jgi:hypothetical protein
MHIDSAPQPCPHCARSTVLATYHWGRQWVHVGTWRPQCGWPGWTPGGRQTEDVEPLKLAEATPVGSAPGA